MLRAGIKLRSDAGVVGVGLLLTTAAALTRFVASGRVAPFVASAAALAVLASVVGRAVEHLGDRLGAGNTGVLSAALGNLPELFFGIFALRAGLLTVLQAALVGSILANVLLVLGLAFIAGGARHGTQRFSAASARNLALLLLLAVAVLVVPTLAALLHGPASHHVTSLSDAASVVLLGIFALSIPSALAHKDRASWDPNVPPQSSSTEQAKARHSMWGALAMLGVGSLGSAAVSDWFVHSLSPALAALHFSQAFAGVVVVAIASNAVENAVGIRLARANRSDHAVALVLQAPVQVALVLFPALVLLSGAIGGVHLSLDLPPMLVVSLALAAVVNLAVVYDGESTWLEGACLVGLYVVISAALWWG